MIQYSLLTTDPGLYMIGYGTGKIILKLPPFWILNEELQELEIQMKTKI